MQSLVARSLALLSTLALFGTLGCKQEEPRVLAVDYPNEMAEGYCSAVFGCPCDGYPYANITECFTDLVTAYDALNDAAYLAGLNYDGACPARELASIEALGCQGYVAPLPAGTCLAPCNPWHGTLAAGFPCGILASSPELGIGFSNCAQGLVCTGGVCVNPCQAGGVLPGIGQPCPEMVCAAGAMCDETLTCVAIPALPGPGQPCANGVCDPNTAVCVPAANTCAALPAIGQPCIEFQCNPTGYCNADNFCVARPALACGLLGGGVPGDGDGDPTTTGDGDGDPTTTAGDGDGDPGSCSATAIPSTVPTQWAGDTTAGSSLLVGGCGGSGPEDVLTYVVPQSGLYLISTEGTPYDTILYVREGDCNGLELACDDDSASPASIVELELFAGQEVSIIVDAYSEGGNYILSIDLI